MKRSAAIALGLGIVALVGCSPANPLDRIFDAESPAALAIWQRRPVRALSPSDARRFDETQKELQWFTVAEWPGLPSQVQVRQFIVQDHQLANVRCERLLTDQRRLLIMHDELLLRPNTTTDGYQLLSHAMQRIGEQIEALSSEVAANNLVIRELGAAVPATGRSAKRLT